MITVSPGSSRLTKHASMPAEPVPLIGSVSVFAVRNTARSRSPISSSTTRKSGSRCPSTGRWNASITSGYGFDGPGPSNSRSGCIMPRRYDDRRARPSRMSASETSSSSKPQWRITDDDHDHAADDHVDPARLEPGVVAALRDRLGRERAEHLLGRGRGVSRKWWMRSLSARVDAELDRAHRPDRARRADQRLRAGGAGQLRGSTSARWSRTTDTRLAQLLGRRRIGVQELLGEPHAPDVDRDQPVGLVGADDELGRAAADVDHEVRLGFGRARRSRPRNSSARFFLAARSARAAHRAPPRPGRRTRRGSSRRATRSSRSRARARRRVASIASRYSREHGERALDRVGMRAGASAFTP